MIYTIGNSHAHVFTHSKPNYKRVGYKHPFKSISIGPTIAYNFYERHYPKVLHCVKTSNITLDDYIVLVVGEVDCRWHLPKQAVIQNKDINCIVKECVDRFFSTHLDLKSKGFKVISWGGHPSTNNGHDDNPNQPIYGDVLFRNKVTKIWDNYLKSKSDQNNIVHISIVDELLNNDGTTKMEYYIDYCHLNYTKVNEIIIKKFKESKIL